MNHLEEDGQVEVGDEHATQSKKLRCSCGADESASQHRKGYHGVVSLSMFPHQKYHKSGSSSHKEANDDGAAPRVLIPGVLEGQ